MTNRIYLSVHQKMAESWGLPFMDAFGAAKNIPVSEVSVINDFLFDG
jgi:hypothetical protein